MDIQAVIALIPEDPTDEALLSIESIVTYPADNRARVRCHLTQPFRLFLQVRGELIQLTAERWPGVSCRPEDFLGQLRRLIYDIDSALASGRYQQTPPQRVVLDVPEPPSHMEIPVWDEQTGRWHDAEY